MGDAGDAQPPVRRAVLHRTTARRPDGARATRRGHRLAVGVTRARAERTGDHACLRDEEGARVGGSRCGREQPFPTRAKAWRGACGRTADDPDGLRLGDRALAPEVAPAVVANDVDTTLAEDVKTGWVAIRLAIVHAPDVGVDDHLGAHHTGRGADEHDLARQLGARLDQGVLLRMKATTIS